MRPLLQLLGRGVVVRAGDDVPGPWRDGVEVVAVGPAEVEHPAEVVDRLHSAWSERRAVVVALDVDPARFREPATEQAEPWTLGARFELPLDRLHFLVWANTYDAREGREPTWWWGRKAIRLGATEAGDDAAGDVVLPDGRPAWIDGGPRSPLDGSALGGAVVVHAESIELGRLTVTPPPSPVTADLAPDQLAAVAHGAGPARIIAPAGSGKTRVLTERLRHLIVDRGVERELVLAVAYNKKAQTEMESRTVDFRPRVSTLNALGYRLLQDDPRRRGRLRVAEEREVRGMLDGLVPTPRQRVNTDPVAPYLEGLAQIRLGLRDPAEVEAERDDVPGLAAAFGPYRRRLADAGAVDFDEQIYAAVELLLRDGDARRRAQAGCRHLLVDELQDLTPAHVLLVRLLASPALDVFGVGDDDQVIYGHAGADPSFLIDFASLFPGAVPHPLEVNYRCPATVVDAARTLLSYNHRRVDKVIRAGPAADPDPAALTVRPHAAEDGAGALVDVVRGWLGEGVAAADVAVLARVNSLLLAPHVALVEAGVPVSSQLARDVLDRAGVRAALAYLRLGAAPDALQPADLNEVRRRPSRGFPRWIEKWFNRTMSLDDLRRIGDRLDDDKVAAKVAAMADDLAKVAAAVATGTTRSALAVIADDVGLAGAMSLLDSSKGGQTASQVDDLDALAQVAALHADPRTFERWLRGVLARPGTEGGVTLSTVHRVKGMEWDRVAVVGVTAGVLPHRLAEDEEEERRVLHVAITRCRHRVVVLADAARPSPFLGELDGSAPHRDPSAPRPTGAAAAARKQKDKAAPAVLPAEAEPVAAALKAWRLERSRADKVAAFIVLSNAVLNDIAVARPSTMAELARIKGMGPKKLDDYGDEILAVLDSLG